MTVPITKEAVIERPTPISSTSRLVAWLTGGALVALLLVPADRLYSIASNDLLAYDFRQTFLPAAEALFDGRSPYPEYGYPPLVAFLSVPFALLPSAEVLLTGLPSRCVPAFPLAPGRSRLALLRRRVPVDLGLQRRADGERDAADPRSRAAVCWR